MLASPLRPLTLALVLSNLSERRTELVIEEGRSQNDYCFIFLNIVGVARLVRARLLVACAETQY
jgi:hypothetical protein